MKNQLGIPKERKTNRMLKIYYSPIYIQMHSTDISLQPKTKTYVVIYSKMILEEAKVTNINRRKRMFIFTNKDLDQSSHISVKI